VFVVVRAGGGVRLQLDIKLLCQVNMTAIGYADCGRQKPDTKRIRFRAANTKFGNCNKCENVLNALAWVLYSVI